MKAEAKVSEAENPHIEYSVEELGCHLMNLIVGNNLVNVIFILVNAMLLFSLTRALI